MEEKAHRPINLAFVKCGTIEKFYDAWAEFMTPYHHLARRERNVFAVILAQYFRLRSQCSDESMVHSMLWSSASRSEMRRQLNISQPHFQMVLAKLRERGVLLKNDTINPRLMPHIYPDSRSLELRLVFDYSTPSNKETPIDETVKEG